MRKEFQNGGADIYEELKDEDSSHLFTNKAAKIQGCK